LHPPSSFTCALVSGAAKGVKILLQPVPPGTRTVNFRGRLGVTTARVIGSWWL
jgi:hypothetical protein